jgi:CheY-like chemotaxis protein
MTVTVCDFDRLSVLVVEDNSYVRNIMQNLLRRLRFGQVSGAPNGAEAIDYFKTLHDAQRGASLDLVISDLLMSPMNGLLLLRWLRTAKESPNRMIPFIMLSGAADREYVNAARDLGGTEFLAKPFSVQTVYRKILEVIEYPRQFVTTHDYFGPDRRRKAQVPPDKERRVKKESDVVIVYSADKVVKPKTPADVWHFRLPNALKEKAGGVGRSDPLELPLGLLEEAEAQLKRDAVGFDHWAQEYLVQLSQLCTEALEKQGDRSKYFHEINLLAHELRGQGGTFGYALITTFGKMLYDCTYEGCRQDDNAVEVVKAHIDAMRAVLRDKVKGDGGDVGRALILSLEEAVDRCLTVD